MLKLRKVIALTDADGKTLMNLEKRQLPEYSVNDLAGEWIISTVNGTELEKQENVPFLAFNIEENVYMEMLAAML